jgi:hypothetical protein
MSQENVEIVRRVYGAVTRSDWDAAFRAAHPEFEATFQRGPFAGTHRGREVVQALRSRAPRKPSKPWGCGSSPPIQR